MRHDYLLEGYAYRIRPIALSDAAAIVVLRTLPRNSMYIHDTSSILEDQETWLERYFERSGDWYFAIERIGSDRVEGLIGLYDQDLALRAAEWGRWIVQDGSMAAVESARLIYRLAFEKLGLTEAYCRTIARNTKVVAFHDSSGASRTQVLKGSAAIRGFIYDQIEHRVTRELWPTVDAKLGRLAERIAARLNRIPS